MSTPTRDHSSMLRLVLLILLVWLATLTAMTVHDVKVLSDRTRDLARQMEQRR